MVDMSQFIAAKSDQLNADDLMDSPRTITISKVTAQPDAAEQPVSIHYEGSEGRPFKPCKTMRRIMVAVWGKDASKYVGRSMTLYRDPNVQFGGLQVGGIRVSHMSHIDEKKTVALLVTRGRKAPYTVLPLTDVPPVKEDAAAKWAEGYIAKLATFTDLAGLEGFEAEKAGKLAELQGKRPELHAQVESALVARKAELTTGGSDGFDDAPPTPAAEDPVATMVRKIEAAEDEATLTALEKEVDAGSAFLSPGQNDSLDFAIAAARRRIEEEQPSGQAQDRADEPMSEYEKIAADWLAAFGAANSVMDLKAEYAKAGPDIGLLPTELRENVEGAYDRNVRRLEERNAKAKAREQREAAEGRA